MQATMQLRPQGSLLSWKFGPRGRDSRADQKDRGLWERNCGIICNLLKATLRAGTEIHDAEDEKCSQINSVSGQWSYYVVSVWKVVFWHLVASTHGISVFQSDQIRLDWTTPGQRSQVGWHALRNFLARVLSTLWSTGANNKLCDICFDPLWWKKKLWISQRSKHSWSFNWCVDSKLSKVAVLPEDDIYPKDS